MILLIIAFCGFLSYFNLGLFIIENGIQEIIRALKA